VLLLPPAPAARVLLGRTLAARSARSAAAFLRMAVAGPPGALGEAARAVVEPVDEAALTGDEGRGEDCVSDTLSESMCQWKDGRVRRDCHCPGAAAAAIEVQVNAWASHMYPAGLGDVHVVSDKQQPNSPYECIGHGREREQTKRNVHTMMDGQVVEQRGRRCTVEDSVAGGFGCRRWRFSVQ
jgi:hypothetical protein